MNPEDREGRLQEDELELSISRQALTRLEGRAERAERKLVAIEKSKAWRIVRGYWDVRERLRGRAPSDSASDVQPVAVVDTAPAPSFGDQHLELGDGFVEWVEGARQARGDQVVLMFSNGPSYHSKRATRSIQLANVYLNDECPVFFTYDRPEGGSLAPTATGGLLLQSPTDLAGRLLARLLESDFGDKEKVLFVSFPDELMVRYMLYASQHGWKTVYDVQQDWEELARVGVATWYEPAYEWYTARYADFMTAVAWPLARKIEALSGRSVVINSNAYDEHFPARTPAIDPDGPVVGYFGNMNDKWFDWDLLINCARRHPEIEFQLAGHHAPVRASYPENVELLGLLTHEEIAEASSRWVAAIVPLKIGPMTDSRDPIKVYEYLHLGLPVLATYMPQLHSRPGVTVTESPGAFIEAIRGIVERGVQGSERQDDWLAMNTWDLRVKAYRDALLVAEPARSLPEYLLGDGR